MECQSSAYRDKFKSQSRFFVKQRLWLFLLFHFFVTLSQLQGFFIGNYIRTVFLNAGHFWWYIKLG